MRRGGVGAPFGVEGRRDYTGPWTQMGGGWVRPLNGTDPMWRGTLYHFFVEQRRAGTWAHGMANTIEAAMRWIREVRGA